MHEAIKILKLQFVLILLAFLLGGCTNSVGDPDDEEGGVIGTGLILKGTVTDVRAFASNSLEIKARSGELSNAVIDDTGRYHAPTVRGAPPFLLRADLGNNEYRYGIAFDNERANVHSYSDVVLRNWFESSNGDIDFEFTQQMASTMLPTRQQFLGNAEEIFSLVELVLESYDVTGMQLLAGDYDSSTSSVGVVNYLLNNPVLIQEDNIAMLITDPETKTQSTTKSGFSLFELADQPDTEVPETPKAVRALASAIDEVIVVWEPSFDNRGVAGYDVIRDGVKVSTTPYPVFIDSGLESDRLYSYEIIAIDSSQNTSASSLPVISGTLGTIDSTPPPKPVQLAVNAILGRMELIWGQSSIGDVVSFEVYRGRSDDPIEYLASVTSSVMTDVTVSSGIDFCYQVAAVDASGNESEKSEKVCRMAEGEQITRSQDLSLWKVPLNAGLTIPNVENLACLTEWTQTVIDTPMRVDAGCYLVDEPITISNGGNLTLDAGVVMKFGAQTGVVVNLGGSFTSVGTASDPVVLTSQDPTPGYWSGIKINNSNSARNKLVNTVVEYAGGGRESAAVALETGNNKISRVDISSSVIRSCVGAGIRASGKLSLVNRLDGTVITDCDIPLVAHIHKLDGITQRNDLTLNSNDVVDIGNAEVVSDMQLKDLGIPYIATDILVQSGNLSILEGVEVQMRAGGEVKVVSSLTAAGTQNRRITFTGTVQERGHWVGVIVPGTASVEYVDVQYAGGRNNNRSALGSLLIEDGDVSIKNVHITASASYAVNAYYSGSQITNLTKLVLVGNRKSIRIPIGLAKKLGGQVDLIENDDSNVELTGLRIGDRDIELYDIGVPYLLTESVQLSYGGMEFHPGVTVNMTSGVSINVSRNAWLSVTGTLDKPIVMSHESGLAGAWSGISISSSSSRNHLKHAVIRFAGDTDGSVPAAIKLACWFSASLNLENTSIEDSAGWAVLLDEEDGCSLSIGDDVTFKRNVLGDIGVE